MYGSSRSLIRASFIAFLIMWFATLAREPGGIEAFAVEMGEVEAEVAAAAHAGYEAMLPTLIKAEKTGYWGGLVCSPEKNASGQPVRQECVETQPDMLDD